MVTLPTRVRAEGAFASRATRHAPEGEEEGLRGM